MDQMYFINTALIIFVFIYFIPSQLFNIWEYCNLKYQKNLFIYIFIQIFFYILMYWNLLIAFYNFNLILEFILLFDVEKFAEHDLEIKSIVGEPDIYRYFSVANLNRREFGEKYLDFLERTKYDWIWLKPQVFVEEANDETIIFSKNLAVQKYVIKLNYEHWKKINGYRICTFDYNLPYTKNLYNWIMLHVPNISNIQK